MASDRPSYGGTTVAAHLVFLVLGGYSLLAQVILLRECFSLLAGNELSAAVQLWLWLCFTAAGGLLGAALPGRSTGPLLAALPFAGAWSVVAVRLLPLLLPTPLGAEVPLGWAVLALAAAQLPLNLLCGALFPVACRFYTAPDARPAIGRWYAVEALGAALAGGVCTFVLAGRVRGVDAAIAGSGALALVAAVILWRRFAVCRVVAAAGAVLLAAATWLGPAEMVDAYWWRARHPGSVRLNSLESRYQRLDLGRREGQHTVYCNGVPALTLEDQAEAWSGDRLADLYLSLHPDPRRVLIIGNGDPGLPARALEYPIDRLVYCLADPGVLEIAEDARGRGSFDWVDERLVLAPGDGRRYVQSTSHMFDVIVLDLPAPMNAAGNRFFTVEAFAAARSRLRQGGRLVLRLPSSSHYVAAETRLLLASVHRALERAFGEVAVVAGDYMIFVAGEPTPTPDLATMARRFAGRQPPLTLPGGRTIAAPEQKELLFNALYEPLFDAFRQEQQLAELRAAIAPLNTDVAPVAYYLNLRRWLRETGAHPALATRAWELAEGAADFLRRWGRLGVLLVGALLLLAGVLGRRRCGGGGRRTVLALAVLVSGWAGMIGELALLFMYQNAFGRVYQAIGALLATYMLALVAGSAASAGLRLSPNGRTRCLLGARVLMIVSCLAALALARTGSAPRLFIGLFLYAFAIGLEYPLANRIYAEDEGGRRAAGVLHAMDHLGGAVGTLIGGTLLLPLLGSGVTLAGIAAVHLLVLCAMLGMLTGRRPTSQPE